jgi:nicotinate phosphoribosyltransferase
LKGQALKTDLYQLTMAGAYFARGFRDVRVTCEAFLRRLPARRSFLVMAGVPRLLEYLADLAFTDDDIAFLGTLAPLRPAMTPAFVDYLRGFRFTGDVWAAPEGAVVFADEPIVRVTAPIIEAQIVETYLLSVLNHAVKVASKAARVVLAARGRGVIEFGTRRTHDEAAVDAARAAYVAGCIGTANVEAARRHGVPVFGTSAHMFIMAHARPGVPNDETERAAFSDWAATYPDKQTYLVDTYDTLHGVDDAIAAVGPRLGGIRLDSGDIGALARAARARLDAAGLTSAKITASSGLEEHEVSRLVLGGSPIDSFGVGENLTEPVDAPITGIIYKVVRNETFEVDVAKKAAGGKATRPGVKQVYRRDTPDPHDLVALASETGLGGAPLLVPVLEAGRALPLASLADARARCKAELARLPKRLTDIPADPDAPAPEPYRVEATPALEAAVRRALGSGSPSA